ncbi:DDE_3 domain-containing protein [Trichonephila clavipes]|nr:DDE_3 domain-containing protein [Trichonephila clavipes]
MITVKRHLRKPNIYVRAAILESLVRDVNAKRSLQWCRTPKTWSIDKGKKVIWPAESSFIIGRGHVWRTPAQSYDRDCLFPGVKHE